MKKDWISSDMELIAKEHFYKVNFWNSKNNRWKKTEIKEYYLGLSRDDREHFIKDFKFIFRGKSANDFLNAVERVNSMENRNLDNFIFTPSDFKKILRCVHELKRNNELQCTYEQIVNQLLKMNVPFTKSTIENYLKKSPGK